MIIVLGAGGLLGSHFCAKFAKDTLGYTHEELDIADLTSFEQVIASLRPDAVINCAGIVKNQAVENFSLANTINTSLPPLLARICGDYDTKFIHISTDCVFSGRRGDRKESDTPDPIDVYGLTKLGGEVTTSPHLTVRTSFVGYPDFKGRGLLSWLKSQSKDALIPGYTRVFWNGLTTLALSEYLYDFAYNRVSGLVHLGAQKISKYSLLATVNRVYSWGYVIKETGQPEYDRSLLTERGDLPIIPGTTNFEEMVREMKSWEERLWQALPL